MSSSLLLGKKQNVSIMDSLLNVDPSHSGILFAYITSRSFQRILAEIFFLGALTALVLEGLGVFQNTPLLSLFRNVCAFVRTRIFGLAPGGEIGERRKSGKRRRSSRSSRGSRSLSGRKLYSYDRSAAPWYEILSLNNSTLRQRLDASMEDSYYFAERRASSSQKEIGRGGFNGTGAAPGGQHEGGVTSSGKLAKHTGDLHDHDGDHARGMTTSQPHSLGGVPSVAPEDTSSSGGTGGTTSGGGSTTASADLELVRERSPVPPIEFSVTNFKVEPAPIPPADLLQPSLGGRKSSSKTSTLSGLPDAQMELSRAPPPPGVGWYYYWCSYVFPQRHLLHIFFHHVSSNTSPTQLSRRLCQYADNKIVRKRCVKTTCVKRRCDLQRSCSVGRCELMTQGIASCCRESRTPSSKYGNVIASSGSCTTKSGPRKCRFPRKSSFRQGDRRWSIGGSSCPGGSLPGRAGPGKTPTWTARPRQLGSTCLCSVELLEDHWRRRDVVEERSCK